MRRDFDFVKYSKLTTFVAVFLMSMSLCSIVFRGLNLSIDFVGGVVVEFSQGSGTVIEIAEVREVLSEAGISDYIVQSVKSSGHAKIPNIMVRVGVKNRDDYEATMSLVKNALQSGFSDSEFVFYKTDYVSPQVGVAQAKNTILALLVSFLVIASYVIIRFSFAYSVGVLLAIFHDALITLGLASLFQLNIDISAVAAILTIMGYSVNDSVVIYDRIRELRKLELKSTPIGTVVNRALNLTLSRTFVTSGTTALSLVAIIFLGGAVVQHFAILILFGVFIGTLSSITVSTNALLWLLGRGG